MAKSLHPLSLEYWLIRLILGRALAKIGIAQIVKFLMIIEYRLGCFLAEASQIRGIKLLLSESRIEFRHSLILKRVYSQMTGDSVKIFAPEEKRLCIFSEGQNNKQNIYYIRGGTATIEPVQRFVGTDCVALSDKDLLAMYGELERSLNYLYQNLYFYTQEPIFLKIAKDEQLQHDFFEQLGSRNLQKKWKFKKIMAWIYFLVNREFIPTELAKCLSLKVAK
jgi:hypothetical protein